MIPYFGPHTPFILASYAIEAAVLAGLVAWLMWDGRRQQASLDALDHRRKPGRSP